MPPSLMKALLAGTILALAGCAAQTPPVEVTRFHLQTQIAPGELAVEPRDKTAAHSLEFDMYANAVREQFGRLGFHQAANLPASELVAIVDFRTGLREGPPRGPAFSIGLGGGSFGRGGGVGGGVNLPVGRPRSGTLILSELSVQLKRRSDGTVIWEGRAQGAAREGTPDAAPQALANRLAAALFAGFPGESGRTIRVP